MRVLITGGTGFVGMHTARRLAAEGVAVRLLVRDVERARRSFARWPEPPPDRERRRWAPHHRVEDCRQAALLGPPGAMASWTTGRGSGRTVVSVGR